MKRVRFALCFAATLCMFLTVHAWSDDLPYKQRQDLVYGEVHGAGLLMDVFTPTGKTNGIGIIDIASGSWYSDRGKIRDHKLAGMFDIFCGKGYTVFAIRPGSRTKYTVLEMIANVNTGIRYVKAHAEEYGLDPERLGITGGSAGAHLASLAVVTAQDGNPEAKDELRRFSTHVAAVGIFFPPTNFLEFGEGKPDFNLIGDVLFSGGIEGRTDDEIEEQARAISPALNVNGKTPPFIIWHGDADPLVPLQQSEFFVEQLKAAGTDVELHIKAGGGHPWITIPEEVQHISEWFDRQFASN